MLLFILVYRRHGVLAELPAPEACHCQAVLGGPFFFAVSILLETWKLWCVQRVYMYLSIYIHMLRKFAFIYLQAAAEPTDPLRFLAEGLNLSISEASFLASGLLLFN